ncbi:MAG: glycosyltransferase family 2 protein [Candidatus Bathyarchaeia archaeon]
MPKVSVVIGYYKKQEDADECLFSVFKTNYPDFEVLLIDNGSHDGAAEFFKEKYGRLKIAKNAINRGSGGAWNTGFNLISGDSKYVAFIDCDVVVEPDWLIEMVKVAERSAAIGGCQPKILSYWQPDMFEYNGSAGMWMDVYGYALNRGRVFYHVEKDEGQYDLPCETFFIGGSVFFVRCDILREIGLFDESFFIYHEELDLAWRIRLNGYKVVCIPSSVVWHKGGGKRDKTTLFRKHRNNIYMMIKNYGLKNLVRYLPPRFFLDLASVVVNGFTPIMAYAWLIKNFRLVWSHRVEVQSRVRRRTDEELMEIKVKQPSPILHYAKGYKTWRDFLAVNPQMFRPIRSK